MAPSTMKRAAPRMPNKGINTLFRGELSYVAVQGLGLAAKLEHLPQHGNPPLAGRVPKQSSMDAHGFGICVIAIVDDR